MSSDSESSSSSSGEDAENDRIKYLKAKIAKLERKKKKIDRKEKKLQKKGKKKDKDVEPNVDVKSAREEWMTAGDIDNAAFPCFSLAEVKAERKKEREERLYQTDASYRSRVESRKLMENPGTHARELNPYWKDGGTGLPAEDPSSSSKSSIGDGGSSWLRRAFRRAKEMAEEQGKPLEEIIAERWGSVEKLQKMMSAAEGRDVRLNLESRPKSSHKDSNRYKRPSDADASSGKPAVSSRSSGTRGWKKRKSPEPESDSKRSPERAELSSRPTSRKGEIEEPKMETEDDYLLTPKELNALGAKILRAELMGDKATAAKLQAKLDKAREMSAGKRIVVADQTPRDVQKVPTRMTAEMQKYKFDDKNSLHSIFVTEKNLTDAGDGDRALFNKMSARAAKSAALGVEERVQPDEWDEDGTAVEKSAKTAKREAKEAMRSELAEKKRMEAIDRIQQKQLETCRRCFHSSRMIKHLMIAMGSFTYLSVPGFQSLVDGHCLISPLSHVPSSLTADENEWEEIKNFAKSLVRMFQDRGEDCVFFEYFAGDKSKAGFPHLTIECVPLPRELGDQAPIYFKKALMECETEWSQNKKVVDIPRGRDVRSVIPRGLPYFFISLAWDEIGFAHVIEDLETFPRNFAQEIIGGMLELDPRLWRKPFWEPVDAQFEKVEAFSKGYSNYDWTAK